MTTRPTSVPVFLWRVYDSTSPWKKKGGWRELGWEMTEAHAVAWAKANGFERIEKVPGSEKTYEDVDGRLWKSSDVTQQTRPATR